MGILWCYLSDNLSADYGDTCCAKNGFNNACLNFYIWLSFICRRQCESQAINASWSSGNHPGLLSKSHFLPFAIHFQWIGSVRSQIDTSHYGTGQISLSSFTYKKTTVNVHLGFEAKYKMKISVGHLTS